MEHAGKMIEELQAKVVPQFPSVRVLRSMQPEEHLSFHSIDEFHADLQLQVRIDAWRAEIIALHKKHAGPKSTGNV